MMSNEMSEHFQIVRFSYDLKVFIFAVGDSTFRMNGGTLVFDGARLEVLYTCNDSR